MPDIDDRRQRTGAQVLAQASLEILIEEHDLVLLRDVRARQQERQAERKPAADDRQEGAPQLANVPGRGDGIDIIDADGQLGKRCPDRVLREFVGLLDAVLALFLEHELGHAVLEERQSTIMRLGYDTKDSHSTDTATLNLIRPSTRGAKIVPPRSPRRM